MVVTLQTWFKKTNLKTAQVRFPRAIDPGHAFDAIVESELVSEAKGPKT